MHHILWEKHFGDLTCSHTVDDPPENNCPMHTHEFLEMYYFISGNCTYIIEGTAYALKPHDILFKRPLEAHKLNVNSDKVPYERVGISLPISFFQSIDPDNALFSPTLSRPLGTGNRFTENDFGHSLCTELMERLARHGATMGRTEILSVILFVAAETSRVLQSGAGIHRNSDIGSQLIDYVNSHLFSDVTPSSVSQKFFLSQSQINRIFRANTGSTLTQYVTTKRLLTAHDRIRSGVPCSEVCYTCGYHDYSSFYRAYLKRFGHAPTEDR